MLSKKEILNLIGEITWLWNHLYFIETEKGNFVWSCVAYAGGDHTLTRYEGTYVDCLEENNLTFGRSKGSHRIGGYCGDDVTIIWDSKKTKGTKDGTEQ